MAQLLANGVVGFPLDPHVDVFRVLPINDHVKVLGTLVGAGGACVVAAWPNAAVEIKDLSKGHIQGADAASHRCCEGALDSDAIGADRIQGVVRQVLVCAVQVAGFIAGVHLEPFNGFAPAIGFSHSRIEHFLGGGPYIYPRSIASDERNDRIVGNHGLTVLEADRSASAGGSELLELDHGGGARFSPWSL